MNKLRLPIVILSILLTLGVGITVLSDRHYYLISILLILISLFCFYYQYENKKPKSREIVLLAIMISLVVLGRLIFILTPSFKPTLALIIIYGMVFGRTSGFVCGSLSAFMANFFFGQGPWTPFQMLSCGLIGYFAGVLLSSSKEPLRLHFIGGYGILSAVLYSLIMDIWGVLALDGTFNFPRYLVSLTASLPIMVIYIVSNLVFLILLSPVMVKKMKRIQQKYGLFEGGKYEKIIK